MATLTADQVRLKSDGDVGALYAAIMAHLCVMDEHWWCKAPAAMMELLPLLASPEPPARLLSGVGKMLTSCRACGRAYHNKVVEWRATTDLQPDEADSVVSVLRDWDASRVVPGIKQCIAEHMVCCDIVEASRIQTRTEDILAEVLCDMRLVSRPDVSRALGWLFSEFNVALPDRLLPPPPGVYALAFSICQRSSEWAIGALYQYEECPAPPGVKSVVQAVVERILPVDRGRRDSIVDLTEEDLSDEAAARTFVADCQNDGLWLGLAAALYNIEKRDLEDMLGAYPKLLQAAVDQILSSNILVARSAAGVLRRYLYMIGSLQRHSSELTPLYIAEVIIAAHRAHGSGAAHDASPQKPWEWCVLYTAFPLFKCCISDLGSLAEVLPRLLAYLFGASVPPRSVGRLGQVSARVPQGSEAPSTGAASAGYRVAGKLCARLCLMCYEHVPDCVPVIDSDALAGLLCRMVADTSGSDSITSRLLRAILMFDAASISSAICGPEVSCQVEDIRPRHGLEARGEGKRMDSFSRPEFTVSPSRTGGSVESSQDVVACDSGDDEDNVLGSSNTGQVPDSLSSPRFHWARPVWENVMKGRFRFQFRGKNFASCSEGETLLEVHGMIGLLDLPVSARDDGNTRDLTLDEARKNLEKVVAKSTDESGCLATSQATLEFAHVMVLDIVASQLERVQHQATRHTRDPWIRLVPHAAGHLLASSRRDIRQHSISLLSGMLPSSTLDVRIDAAVSSVSVSGTLRGLLLHREYSVAVTTGTAEAVRVLAVFGTAVAFRCYLHMLSFLEQMLKSDTTEMQKFLDNRGRNQVVCLIELFFMDWEELQVSQQRLFPEACSRILRVLGRIWDVLVRSSNKVEVEKTHEELLESVMGLHKCKNLSVLSNWAQLVGSVGKRYSVSPAHTETLAGVLASSREDLPKAVRDALVPVVGVAGVSINAPVVCGREANLKRSVSSGKADSVDSEVVHVPNRSDIERAQHVQFKACVNELQSSWKGSAPGRQLSSESLRLLRVKKKLELPSVAMKRPRDRLRQRYGTHVSRPAGRRRVPPVKTGKLPGDQGPRQTLMEMKVEQYKRQKELEKKEKKKGEVLLNTSSETLQKGSGHGPSGGVGPPAAVEHGKKADLDGPSHKATSSRMPKTSARAVGLSRTLKPRTLGGFHRSLVSLNPREISYCRGRPAGEVPKAPTRFGGVEDYVVYWESILLFELRAQIYQAMEQEEDAARRNGPCSVDSDSWVCRAPFEAVGPPDPEPGGRYKLLKLLFCGNGMLRDSCPREDGPRQDNKEDFSASNLRSSDLVRLQMAKRGRGHVEGGHSTSDVAVLLGCVVGVEHRGPDSFLTVKVCFPSTVSEPGPKRAFCVSRLVSLITHHRQIESLWRVSDLPDTMLESLLEPRKIWKAKRLCNRKKLKDDGNLNCQDLVKALESAGLNPSQLEVARLASTMTGRTADPKTAGFTLLQGPPGTGKTSTIVAILGVLLRSSLVRSKRSPLKFATVRSNGATFQVRVAPVRILVCAPSNAAVDEIMTRVMEIGLLTESGERVCPRVARIGSGSKDSRVMGVTISELVGRANPSSSAGAPRTSSRTQEEQEAVLKRDGLRAKLRGISSEIGVAHKERLTCREKHDKGAGERKALAQSARGKAEKDFETADQKLTKTLSALHDTKKSVLAELVKAESKVRKIDQRRDLESAKMLARIVNGASVVFSTLNSAGHESLNTMSGAFDAVIVDEAAQSVEPDILIPLVGSGGSSSAGVSRCILVGDSKQLPATVISTAPNVVASLGKSLFERLESAKYSAVHMLNVQYRMHPYICSFPSSQFYDGRLRNGRNVTSKDCWRPFHFDTSKRFGPLSFLDTSGCGDAHESRGGTGSICNNGEARLVVALICTLVRQYPRCVVESASVAILTPYRRQVSVIRRELGKAPELSCMNVQVSTVDGIQGQEKDIIVMSPVRGGGPNSSGGIGFVKDARRMNVALTRARLSSIVVGNARSLSSSSKDWNAYVSFCEARSCLVPVVSSRDMFPELYSRRTKFSAAVLPSILPTLPDPDAVESDASDLDDVSISSEEILDDEDEFDENVSMEENDDSGRRDSIRTRNRKRANKGPEALGRSGVLQSRLNGKADVEPRNENDSNDGTQVMIRRRERTSTERMAARAATLDGTARVPPRVIPGSQDTRRRGGAESAAHRSNSRRPIPVPTAPIQDDTLVRRKKFISRKNTQASASTVDRVYHAPAQGSSPLPMGLSATTNQGAAVAGRADDKSSRSGRMEGIEKYRRLENPVLPPAKRTRLVGGRSQATDVDKLKTLQGVLSQKTLSGRNSAAAKPPGQLGPGMARGRVPLPVPKKSATVKPVSSGRYRQPVPQFSHSEASRTGKPNAYQLLMLRGTTGAGPEVVKNIPARPTNAALARAQPAPTAPVKKTPARATSFHAPPKAAPFSLADTGRAMEKTVNARRNIQNKK